MSEWVELSGYEKIGTDDVGVRELIATILVKREDISRCIENDRGIGCRIHIKGGMYLYDLAGEYDIVRDEIIGGKWSRVEALSRKIFAYQTGSPFPWKTTNTPSDMEPK